YPASKCFCAQVNRKAGKKLPQNPTTNNVIKTRYELITFKFRNATGSKTVLATNILIEATCVLEKTGTPSQVNILCFMRKKELPQIQASIKNKPQSFHLS